MNPYFVQQELLIITETSFAWAECATGLPGELASKKDRLKHACWNGFVPALLPECFEHPYHTGLNLWEIKEAKCFIKLEYGGFSEELEKEYSINPYSFMEVHIAN